MLDNFNLLVTTYRRTERNACSELQYLLEKIGDSASVVSKSGIAGLVTAKTCLDPFEAINRLRQALHERPYEFRYVLRVIPVEKIVRSDLNEIRNMAVELSTRIKEDETFRITVEKRFTTMHSSDIIKTVAADIKRNVELTKPDKILLVEIVGGLAGVAVVTPHDVLSVQKEKLVA